MINGASAECTAPHRVAVGRARAAVQPERTRRGRRSAPVRECLFRTGAPDRESPGRPRAEKGDEVAQHLLPMIRTQRFVPVGHLGNIRSRWIARRTEPGVPKIDNAHLPHGSPSRFRDREAPRDEHRRRDQLGAGDSQVQQQEGSAAIAAKAARSIPRYWQKPDRSRANWSTGVVGQSSTTEIGHYQVVVSAEGVQLLAPADPANMGEARGSRRHRTRLTRKGRPC